MEQIRCFLNLQELVLQAEDKGKVETIGCDAQPLFRMLQPPTSILILVREEKDEHRDRDRDENEDEDKHQLIDIQFRKTKPTAN